MSIRRFESQIPVKDSLASLNRALDELRHVLRELESRIRALEDKRR